MLKSLIAGVAAIGLITTAAPDKAEAGGNDLLTGIVAGALIIGTIAALDDSYDNRHRHSHNHGHVRVKPKYGHSSHNVYRHGSRIYSNRDNRHRHDEYGYRHRGHNSGKHAGKRHNGHNGHDRDYDRHRGHNGHNGHRHKQGHGHVRARDDHGRDYRHKGAKGGKHVTNRVHDRGALRNDRPRQRDAQRIRNDRQRLAVKDSKLRKQLEARARYIEHMSEYQN